MTDNEHSSESPRNSLEPSASKSCRVYVGNLAWKVHWQDLKDHMRQCGGHVVRADVFEDNQGRSRGCGIVEYETEAAAQEAITKLTDTILFDRKIFVREDREDFDPRPRRSGNVGGSPRPSRGGRGRGGRDTRRKSFPTETHGCQIFVSNLPYKTTWKDLKTLFNEEGHVVRSDVYEVNGRSRGCGTVLFKEAAHAQAAIDKFKDYELQGRNILVRLDEGRPNQRSGSRQ